MAVRMTKRVAAVVAYCIAVASISPQESRAQGAVDGPAETPATPRDKATTRRTHTIGPRYDVGTASAVGIGYLYLVGFPPSEPFFWGIGCDTQAFVGNFDRLEGTAFSGVVRGTIGHSPPMTFEFEGGGLLSSQQVGGVGHAGVFLSFFYADIGYSYQVPLGPLSRPFWLSSHQFSVRVHIPLMTY
jgi:hypothetical protein